MINHKTVFKFSTGVDTLTSKRRDVSISMDKCLDRKFDYTNSISASTAPRDNSYAFGTSYDDVKASEQSISLLKRAIGGSIPMKKQ